MAQFVKKEWLHKVVFSWFWLLKNLRRYFKNTLSILLFLLILLVVSVVTPYFSKAMLYIMSKIPIKVAYSDSDKTHIHPQMIVVLGAGLRKTGSQEITLNKYSKQRLKTSVRLYADNQLPILFSGVESKWVKKWYQDNAVTIKQLILEQKSLNTCENINFTAIKLKTLHINHVYLVTDAYHQQRARMNFARHGIETTPVSASLSQNPKSLSTSRLNYDNSRRAIYELAAIIRDSYFPQSEKQCRKQPKPSKKPDFQQLSISSHNTMPETQKGHEANTTQKNTKKEKTGK